MRPGLPVVESFSHRHSRLAPPAFLAGRRCGAALLCLSLGLGWLLAPPRPTFAAPTACGALPGGSGDAVAVVADPAFSSTNAQAVVNLGSATAAVLTLATFSSANLGNTALTGAWRVTDGVTTSQTIYRSVGKNDDYGIGSVVHIFPAATGTQTYTLAHAVARNNEVLSTTATLVAVALLNLNHRLAQQQTPATTAVGVYTTVPETVVTLTVPAAGGVYLAASLNAQTPSGGGGTARRGAWQLQYRVAGQPTWLSATQGVVRNLSGVNDIGAVSLTALLAVLTPTVTYEFSLAAAAPDALEVETLNATLVAVALANGDGVYPSVEKTSSNVTTRVGTLTNAVSSLITVTTPARYFMGSHYQITATAAVVGVFDLAVGDGTLYNSRDERRTLSGSSDWGSGASVGLTPLLGAGVYPLTTRFATDGSGPSLGLGEITLVGFSLQCVPNAPTAVRLTTFSAQPGDWLGDLLRWLWPNAP